MRLSVAEAAARLGVSPRTVRDRLQRGELKGELVSTKNGAAWLVDWPNESNEEPSQERGDLSALIGEAVSESFGEAVVPLVARADEVARENERLRAQVAALEIVPNAEPEPENKPDESSRNWWRR